MRYLQQQLLAESTDLIETVPSGHTCCDGGGDNGDPTIDTTEAKVVDANECKPVPSASAPAADPGVVKRTAVANVWVLGHGKLYERTGDWSARCSPIPVREWRTRPYVSIDKQTDVRPDIVWDLERTPWSFAADATAEMIVDTTGLGLERAYKRDNFRAELLRVLKPGGLFCGRNAVRLRKTSDAQLVSVANNRC